MQIADVRQYAGKNVVAFGLVMCFKLDGPHSDDSSRAAREGFANPWIVDASYLVATRRTCTTSKTRGTVLLWRAACVTNQESRRNIVIFYTSFCIVIGICIFYCMIFYIRY